MILEVYDLECLSNLFTYTGYRPKEDKWYQYVICDWRNDLEELVKHLTEEKIIQVGFNNKGYDSPLEHHILHHFNEYQFKNGQSIATSLYTKSQTIINSEFSALADKNELIKQIDLYKIWHYNNKARLTSLKDLEICMRMSNVEEMPLHHTTWCKKGDEECVLSYNKNDVKATYLFLLTTLGKTDYPLYKGKNKIQLRMDLNKKFNVNVLNMGDVPMGEELMLQLYSREAGVDPYKLKKSGGTPRPNGIPLKDCIPYWCDIRSKEFNGFLNKIKSTTINGVKGEFALSIVYHGARFDFGQGGAHSCSEPQIWKSDDEWMILDLDVSSLYPSIAKSLGLYPEHLGKLFLNQYVGFIDDRINEKHKPKIDKDNVLIEGYKLVLNGTYGKSNEEKSFLYDPMYTFKTTIAGQTFICMWAERMVKAVPELKFVQVNTDGITIFIPRTKLEAIRSVCNQLTNETGLVIEEAYYKLMACRDVNNYIAVYEDSTKEHEHIKLKGDYEVDKEYHKDPSMRIVSIAVKNYFVYDIPIEETIKNNHDIYDFCLRLKTNSKSQPIFRHLNSEGRIEDDKLGRTTRYYISKSGGALLKDFGDGRLSGVNVGYSVTLFNKFEEKEDYNINYNFYIAEAYKLKNAISTGQLELWK